MLLNTAQLQTFDQNGLVVLPGLFSREDVAALKSELPRLFNEQHPANIAEKSGGAVRTAMALHQRSDTFARLVRHPRLVEPAQQIAGPNLY
ncbi:MAG: phytanoyl-CoA dioxygenase family protein, partial [Pseudomonadota bacterium]|nr:phytanoyl-CoA dioxygenase family protein [Pseudomonadota bacterium]